MGEDSNNSSLNQSVQWLKAIGILLVVMHHLGRSLWFSIDMDAPAINQWQFDDAWVTHGPRSPFAPVFFGLFEWFARWGYVGVHMFVAASIVGHAQRLASGPLDLKPFLWGKIRKIWMPAALSVLAFSSISSKPDWAAALKKIFFISYLEPTNFFSINSPLWFLVLIFQFYVLLPLAKYLKPTAFWPCFWVSCAIAFASRELLSRPPAASVHPYLAHACIFSWAPAIVVGLIIVPDWRRKLAEPSARTRLGFAVALAFTVFMMAQEFRILYAAGDAALALAFVLSALLLPRHRIPTIVTGVAAASFYIYLYHRPLISAGVLRVFRHGENHAQSSWAAFFISLSLVCGAGLLWRTVARKSKR